MQYRANQKQRGSRNKEGRKDSVSLDCTPWPQCNFRMKALFDVHNYGQNAIFGGKRFVRYIPVQMTDKKRNTPLHNVNYMLAQTSPWMVEYSFDPATSGLRPMCGCDAQSFFLSKATMATLPHAELQRRGAPQLSVEEYLASFSNHPCVWLVL
jgi:hypothetical protein